MSTHYHVLGKIGKPFKSHFFYIKGGSEVFNICTCLRNVSLYFHDSTKKNSFGTYKENERVHDKTNNLGVRHKPGCTVTA